MDAFLAVQSVQKKLFTKLLTGFMQRINELDKEMLAKMDLSVIASRVVKLNGVYEDSLNKLEAFLDDFKISSVDILSLHYKNHRQQVRVMTNKYIEALHQVNAYYEMYPRVWKCLECGYRFNQDTRDSCKYCNHPRAYMTPK